MALNNTQYDAIIREYEDKQTRNRHLLEERTAEVYAKVDGYRTLCESVSVISVMQGKKLLEGDEHALTDLHSEIQNLISMKNQLLTGAGYPADYLEPVYDCPDCKDTGYINGAKCHCFKQKVIDILYEQSGIQELLKRENFDVLSYQYYEGEDLERFQNTVSACRNFIKTFDSDYHNLFFYGTVGTGKSFLSGCVAKELIDTGHAVIYFSATGLFDLLQAAAFDSKNREELKNAYADLYQCDLLIIDDLGTELTNQFTASQLFSLLNERALGKKAVIISTNLSLRELQDRYSDRIFSRITSNFTVCKLTGPDIRMYQKRQQSRK